MDGWDKIISLCGLGCKVFWNPWQHGERQSYGVVNTDAGKGEPVTSEPWKHVWLSSSSPIVRNKSLGSCGNIKDRVGYENMFVHKSPTQITAKRNSSVDLSMKGNSTVSLIKRINSKTNLHEKSESKTYLNDKSNVVTNIVAKRHSYVNLSDNKNGKLNLTDNNGVLREFNGVSNRRSRLVEQEVLYVSQMITTV